MGNLYKIVVTPDFADDSAMPCEGTAAAGLELAAATVRARELSRQHGPDYEVQVVGPDGYEAARFYMGCPQ